MRKSSFFVIASVLSLSGLLMFTHYGGTVDAKPAKTSNQLILNLPTRSIGTLRILGNEVYPIQAKGRLTFPPGTALLLVLNYDTASDLSPLKKIQPNGLNRLNMEKLEITDDQLVNIEHLTGLQGLDLQETDVTNKGLVHLQPLKNLSNLNLRSTLITGAGMVQLKPLQNLHTINFASTNLGDDGLECFKDLPNLKDCAVARCRIGDKGMKSLCALKQLTKLDVGYNKDITDGGMSFIVGMNSLKQLIIPQTSITVKSLRYLRQLPALREVVYSAAMFDKKQIAEMQRALPKCKFTELLKYRDADIELFEPLH